MNTLNDRDCEGILQEAEIFSYMTDDEIRNVISHEQRCTKGAIKILRGVIDTKALNIAFPLQIQKHHVGEGGFGHVSMHRELISKKDLSIKLIHNDMKSLDSFDIQTSADLLACRKVRRSIAHCLLGDTVAVYRGEGTLDGEAVECYDYIPGNNMDTYINCEDVEAEDRISISIDIATGLTEFHKKKLLYRDLSPKNIIITPSLENNKRRAVIIDFDLLTDVENYRHIVKSQSETMSRIRPPEAFARDFPELETDFEKFAFAYDAYTLGVTLVILFEGRIWVPKDDGNAISFNSTQYQQNPTVLYEDLTRAFKAKKELTVDLPDDIPQKIHDVTVGLLKLNWRERMSVLQAKVQLENIALK